MPCDCNTEAAGYGDTEFPSWSWSGWMGGEIEYRTDMIEGCIINAKEWLTHHTWILWHFRDYHGNLRPLWDREIQKEDLSEETRWRGYAGRPIQSRAQGGSFAPPQTQAKADSDCHTDSSVNEGAEPHSRQLTTSPEWRRSGGSDLWDTRPGMVKVSNNPYLQETHGHFKDVDLKMRKLELDPGRDEEAQICHPLQYVRMPPSTCYRNRAGVPLCFVRKTKISSPVYRRRVERSVRKTSAEGSPQACLQLLRHPPRKSVRSSAGTLPAERQTLPASHAHPPVLDVEEVPVHPGRRCPQPNRGGVRQRERLRQRLRQYWTRRWQRASAVPHY